MQYHSPLFFGNLLSEEGPKQTTRPPQVLASSGLQNRIEKRNLPPTNLTTFVAQRVHRVCWFNGIGPVASGSTRNSPSKLFATGTAGDTTNLITLWASSSSLEQLRDPDVVCVASHVGDCTALQFLPADKVALVSGSSEGSVNLFEAPELQILSDSQGDSELQQTCQLYHHKQGTAVNAVAQHPQRLEVASAGEDGHIILSSFEKESTLRDLVVGGGGGVNALSFISMNTIAAVNTANQLQLWDLGRENINRPAAIFRDASSFNSLYSLGVHPTQPDYVVVGAMDGRTTVWDLRNNRAPVFSSLSHSSCVWQVSFHPTSPKHILSCSLDGSVFMWNFDSSNKTPRINFGSSEDLCISKVHTSDASIDSFDIHPIFNKLLCASDNDAVTMVDLRSHLQYD